MRTKTDRRRGRDDLFYQEVSEGGVLFDPEAEKVYVLNPTAAFVWNCLDGARSVGEIAGELAAALGKSAPSVAQLERDVERTLDEFRRNGLFSAE